MSQILGRYVLEQRIAIGGMGEVFLARQTGPEGFDRPCVVKTMHEEVATDPDFVQLFLEEARLSSRLTHQNIAQVYDFGKVAGTYYLAMEYVEGPSLRDIVRACRSQASHLDLGVAGRIVIQAAQALDYVHRLNDTDGRPLRLVHRDVTPVNLLLSKNGEVKLIDFGIAKARTTERRTLTGVVRGKLAYVSPEQIESRPVDSRADIFSLGLVAYELLTLRRAIRGNTDMEVLTSWRRWAIEPLMALRPNCPPALDAVVKKAMERDPRARFQSGAELADAIEQVLVAERLPGSRAQLVMLATAVPPGNPNDRGLGALTPASPGPRPIDGVDPGPGSTDELPPLKVTAPTTAPLRPVVSAPAISVASADDRETIRARPSAPFPAVQAPVLPGPAFDDRETIRERAAVPKRPSVSSLPVVVGEALNPVPVGRRETAAELPAAAVLPPTSPPNARRSAPVLKPVSLDTASPEAAAFLRRQSQPALGAAPPPAPALDAPLVPRAQSQIHLAAVTTPAMPGLQPNQAILIPTGVLPEDDEDEGDRPTQLADNPLQSARALDEAEAADDPDRPTQVGDNPLPLRATGPHRVSNPLQHLQGRGSLERGLVKHWPWLAGGLVGLALISMAIWFAASRRAKPETVPPPPVKATVDAGVKKAAAPPREVPVAPSVPPAAEAGDDAPDAKPPRGMAVIEVTSVPRMDVFLDGKLQGSTPKTLFVKPGNHRVVWRTSKGLVHDVTVKAQEKTPTKLDWRGR